MKFSKKFIQNNLNDKLNRAEFIKLYPYHLLKVLFFKGPIFVFFTKNNFKNINKI
jgi:hypothetical protein